MTDHNSNQAAEAEDGHAAEVDPVELVRRSPATASGELTDGQSGQPPTETAPKSSFIYAAEIDVSDLNESHALVVSMIGRDKRVLELGCAEGSTTRLLNDHGCRVTGIEIDEKAAAAARAFAVAVHVADLDTADLHELLGDTRFDTIVAADVLEHLRDPVRCVRGCLRNLAPGGEFIMSIPNVAHGDVRLALADGHFDYREWGLLDNTHLRFFTRESLLDFLDRCGLAELEVRRVTRPIGHTEISPPLDRFPELVEHIESDAEATTYQFVLRAASCADDPRLAEVSSRRADLAREVVQLRRAAHELEGYRVAHRRIMHLVCPDLLDGDVVGPSGSPASEKVRAVQRAIESLFDERGAHQKEVEALLRELDARLIELKAMATSRDDLLRTLHEIRNSETYRTGRALLSPVFGARRWSARVLAAWRASGGSR